MAVIEVWTWVPSAQSQNWTGSLFIKLDDHWPRSKRERVQWVYMIRTSGPWRRSLN